MNLALIPKCCFGLAAFGLLTYVLGVLLPDIPHIGGWLVGSLCLLALGFRYVPQLRGFAYTLSIFGAVATAMYYPALLVSIGDFELKSLIVPLLQIIMFGMGTAMSFRDFLGVVRMPKGVLLGVACQYSIMPVVGFSLGVLFGFSPEIAAGMILVGSSPSGLASNVMAFIAKANVALSVTLTAVATLLSPLLTPLLMRTLAGEMIPIDFWPMMLSIVNMVILPVAAGLVFNHFAHGRARWLDAAMPVVSMAGIALIIAIITANGRDSLLTIGLALVFAALLHNAVGYLLGYWACRLGGMDEASCRTIALEVGLQNAGLASGIALTLGKVATVGLAPAVFGPLMNITGSSLATWWRGRPPVVPAADKQVGYGS